MFPHRNFAPSCDDTDEENEASLEFSKKAKELLRSIAPTREEKASRSVNRGPPTLQSIRKRLNFDESFTFEAPSIARQKCQLVEYEEQLEKLRRKNNMLESDLQRISQQNEELNCNVADLRSTVANLKQQLADTKVIEDQTTSLNDSILDRVRNDNIFTAAKKYITWFNISMEQLQVAESILLENNLMTIENKNKILKARPILPMEIDIDDIPSYAIGSIQDFPLIESLQNIEEDDGSTDPSGSSETNNIFHHTQLSPIGNESYQDRSDLLNTTIANSSISSVDVGHKERITYLEQQNSMLLDKLKVASYRAQSALVLEEEKRSLESRVKILDEKLETTLTELAHLRKNQAENMFERVPNGDDYRRALMQMEKIANLELRCKQLNEELITTTDKWKELEEHTNQLNQRLNHRDELISSLGGQLQNANAAFEETKKKLNAITKECNEYKAQLKETDDRQRSEKDCSLKGSGGDGVPVLSGMTTGTTLTDAGNTTQIFHLLDNPLMQAHKDLIEEERTQKRKATEGLVNENETKRSRDEEVDILQKQLNKAEKEREVTLKIHDDTLLKMKKYREFTTSLTGCQIKVTDFEEGLVSVSSIYDENNKQFVFKVGHESVDLMDMGSSSSSNSYNWDKEAEYYIGERSSVPGFLSKITLSLESLRELESVERTHMFSVLHE